jgi:hypothetical protein
MKVGTFLSEVIGWTHAELDAISRRRWQDLVTDTWENAL